jgi:pyrroline-5-carboxylate reductase
VSAPAAPPAELVIIGGGNMGAALLGGLLAAGRDPAALAVCETDADRRDTLTAQFPGVAIAGDVTAAPGAVIAVKPADVAAAARAAASSGARRLLSIAAGVPTTAIEAAVGAPQVAVVRAMPNTPALVGEGASAIAPGRGAGEDDMAWAEAILGAVGLVVRVAEADLDAVTALSGSGPAYLFLVAEALIAAGVDAGLSEELAAALTTQLFVGSARLLADRGDPEALRVMVTSPGGTTAAGLAVLDQRDVRGALRTAVAAAAARSRELAAS